MPRRARRKSSSGIYHVILRGINRQTIFEDAEDKKRFVKTLKKYKDICHFKLYSYCLMNNHIHLLLKEMEEPISDTIKRISSSYVYWYNMKYDRCGHLFQARYKSECVEDSAYFLTVLRYIHQNPVKAGIEKDVFECEWTSMGEYLHETNIVDVDKAIGFYSVNREESMKLFIEHMKQSNDDQCMDDSYVNVRVDDHVVRKYLSELGVKNVSSLQQMDRVDRNAVLAELKELEGVTNGQLSRVSGISKSVIQRIRRSGSGGQVP
ncbi:transposase [Pseudalkalibacillus berkeleyi]|uniref:Transposase n=1 Tax=Pseudalkalibacillus berkeleyi TaxID=1069813 RepID=A0ABS9H1D0_9BACL|nr:transposase [Pseudalkalibacillus berkeleyi]MCF6138808.1 transposase [Pseudalkalibacillus berkeleyi]